MKGKRSRKNYKCKSNKKKMGKNYTDVQEQQQQTKMRH